MKFERVSAQSHHRLLLLLLVPLLGSCGVHFRRGTLGVTELGIPMRTFSDYDTPGYPVGVFDVNGEYVGLAASQAEYVALWNSDSDNQAVGTLSAGGTSLHFLVSGGSLASVRGLRFWQVEATTNFAVVGGSETRVRVDGDSTLYRLGTHGTVGTGNHIVGLPGAWSVSSRTGHAAELDALDYRVRNFPIAAPGTTVTVFHNEDDDCFGFQIVPNGWAGLPNPGLGANLRGTFPEKGKYFIADGYNRVAMNIDFHNITNFTRLSGLEYVHFWWGGTTPGLAAAIPDFSVFRTVRGASLAMDLDTLDDWHVNSTEWPALEFLHHVNILPDGDAGFLADPPRLNRGVSIGYSSISSARVDALVIALESVLTTPTAGGSLLIDIAIGNNPYTAASSAARASLAARGWTVQ